MIRIDEHLVRAPADICYNVAADVESWPSILPHYRWVRFRDKASFGEGVVEMSAYRDFTTRLRYPTWWVSEMRSSAIEPAVYYTHVDGITTGMSVKWELQPRGEHTFIRLFHTWDGPRWPLLRRFAAERVIGPHFVSAIAQRTLAGVARESEARARTRS